MKKKFVCMYAMSVFLTASGAQAERREVDKHVHGEGDLNIVVEGEQVFVELTASAPDILGFERAIKTKEEQDAYNQAEGILKNYQNVIQFLPNDQCSLVEAATIKYLQEDTSGGGHDDHGHDDHGHDDHGHDDHGHDDHGHDDHGHDDHGHDDHGHEAHAEEGAHYEFYVSYLLECNENTQFSELEVPFFNMFANANVLRVNYITDAKTVQKVMKRDDATLNLD